MNNMDLLRAMDKIDPEYIEEAAASRAAIIVLPLGLKKMLAAVACLIVVVGVIFAVMPGFFMAGDAAPDAPSMDSNGGANEDLGDGSDEAPPQHVVLLPGMSESGIGDMTVDYLLADEGGFVFKIKDRGLSSYPVTLVVLARKDGEVLYEAMGDSNAAAELMISDCGALPSEIFTLLTGGTATDAIPMNNEEFTLQVEGAYENYDLQIFIYVGDDVIEAEVTE